MRRGKALKQLRAGGCVCKGVWCSGHPSRHGYESIYIFAQNGTPVHHIHSFRATYIPPRVREVVHPSWSLQVAVPLCPAQPSVRLRIRCITNLLWREHFNLVVPIAGVHAVCCPAHAVTFLAGDHHVCLRELQLCRSVHARCTHSV